MLSKINADEGIIDRRRSQRTYFWFITLRWIIAVIICIISLFARYILKISLPVTPILIISLCILLFNLGCLFLKKHVKSYDLFANIQISADWVALVFLVHFTGGIESPVIFYFIFHVIISAILLSKRACYLQTTFALMLISVLSISEYVNIVSHIHIRELYPESIYDNGIYLTARMFFCITSLYASAFLATFVTNHLRKRENEIVVLKNSITDAYNKLEALDREKSEFMFKVTHELRSPLSAIQSLLKSIIDGYAGDISQKARDLIVRSEKRTGFLIILVNDLLDLVTGKTRKPRDGEMKSVDINEAVRNTAHILMEKARSKDLTLEINPLPEACYINIDPEELNIILTNLIDNAVKYTDKGGTIKINNVTTDKEVRVEITDTGIGIPEDDINKIFDEFYRSKNAKAVEAHGTGLGLAIVNNLMRKYGGDIEVQSTTGKGTAVTVSFPVE